MSCFRCKNSRWGAKKRLHYLLELWAENSFKTENETIFRNLYKNLRKIYFWQNVVI